MENEIKELLKELAFSERDCKDHFNRFEEALKLPFKEQSEACQNDWYRCCGRRNKVIEKLTEFALTSNPE